MAGNKTMERTDPPAKRGDQVEVCWNGRMIDTGVVRSVKWSSQTGWWAEVSADKGTYYVPTSLDTKGLRVVSDG